MTFQSMTVNAVPSDTKKHCYGIFKNKTIMVASIVTILIVAFALCGYFIATAVTESRDVADPVESLKASASRLYELRKDAVFTDSFHCSQIGKDILNKNGSAVDAAIAAMFCNGLYNHQNMGLGGGFFMTVYINDEKKAYVVNARETVPGAVSADTFQGKEYELTRYGPLSVCVPGEVRGMWRAYKRWGKLPWNSLINPTIDLCKTGFPMSEVMYKRVLLKPQIKNDPHLRKMYYNLEAKEFYKPGTILRPPDALCSTLQRIAENGGDDLYNGTLAVDFLDDLEKAGTKITAKDLQQYEAIISDPLAFSLKDGDTLYTPPLPSGGVVLINILNILSGYNFNASSIKDTSEKILTFHRILEAIKYALATKTKLGDDADNLYFKELVQNVTSPEYGEQVRLLINDTSTSNNTATYGTETYNQPDAGTAHLSIIAPNGDAVAVTSSINNFYGACFATLKTGIVMNNVMNDFSLRGVQSMPFSPANSIEPNKRPLSSMCPTIVVDRSGNTKMVIGAAGGYKIISAVALVLIRKLWFNQSIKESVDEPRFYHQLTPMYAHYEVGTTQDIVEGLRAKGHGMVRYHGTGTNVCALYRNATGIYAKTDYRRGGDVAGD